MRPLHVLSVAYPYAPVGPDAVGGAEQVLTALDAALTGAGHHSLVVACEGSRTTGELLAVPLPRGEIDQRVRAETVRRFRRAVAAALDRWPADLVHLHGVDFAEHLPGTDVPTLVTLHLPPTFYRREDLTPQRPATWVHGVSRSQHQALPDSPALLPPIDNGVPVERLSARHGKRGFALCLGRVCPEKGLHLAIKAARRAGRPLLLAGAVFPYPAHQAYFAREVAPRLDRLRRFLGAVGFARKRRLLTAARCLLVPSLAAETSSLVAMEALACGTPVIAFPAGALVEIVEHGRTGFLVADPAEMADAIEAAGGLDPQACRAAARARFDVRQTAARYLQRYRELSRVAA